MIVILLLIIVSLILALIFLVAFIWAIKNKQYDDTHTPGLRILYEENENIIVDNHTFK